MLKPERRHRTTFHEAGGASEPYRLADIANCFQLAAEDAGACEYSLFMVSPAADNCRLFAFMDTAYPRISRRTELFALNSGDRFARRARMTTQPCWWAGDDTSPIVGSLTRCLWAERMPAPEGMPAALTLPMIDENEDAGMAVLWGEGIALSMPALADLQAHCLALFARLAGLRPEPPRTAPPVSRRELECLRLTANGQTSEEIAATLQLSVHTANQYLANSVEKLNATNRMQAVAKALRMGLID